MFQSVPALSPAQSLPTQSLPAKSFPAQSFPAQSFPPKVFPPKVFPPKVFTPKVFTPKVFTPKVFPILALVVHIRPPSFPPIQMIGLRNICDREDKIKTSFPFGLFIHFSLYFI